MQPPLCAYRTKQLVKLCINCALRNSAKFSQNNFSRKNAKFCENVWEIPKKNVREILNFLRKFSFSGNPIRVPGCLMGSRWHDWTQDRCRWGKLWVSYLSPYCTALVLNHEFSCTLGSFHELLGLPLNPIYKIY